MASVVTLRAQQSVVYSGVWTPSSGTIISTLRDIPNNDASHTTSGVVTPAGQDLQLFDWQYWTGSAWEPFSFPAASSIKYIKVRVRSCSANNNNLIQEVYIWTYGTYGQNKKKVSLNLEVYASSTPSEAFSNSLADDPYYSAGWRVDDISYLKMHLLGKQQGVSTPGTLRLTEVFVDVFYNQHPTVTVLGPVGSAVDPVKTPTPLVTWSYTDPEGDSLDGYHVKIFEPATYNASGFNPETSTAAYWDSLDTDAFGNGEVRVGRTLANASTYRAYVKVRDSTVPGMDFSAWGYIEFVTGYDQPAAPVVSSAIADQATAKFDITIQGRENILTHNQSTFENGYLGWENDTNTTPGWDGAPSLNGRGRMKMTAIGAADMAMRTVGNNVLAVTPDLQYTALASFRKVTAGSRSVQVLIRWYTAAAALISTTTGGTVSASDSGWTQASATAAAPATAAFAILVVQVVAPSAAEVWYVDAAGLAPGSSLVWTRGGMITTPGEVIDTFTRADSATTMGSPELGVGATGWTPLSGTWGISSNAAYLVSSATATYMTGVTTPYHSDGIIESTIKLSPNRAVIGFYFRSLDATNFLYFALGTQSGGMMALVKVVAGVATFLVDGAGSPYVTNGEYKMRVEFFGKSIKVYRDGTLILEYTLSDSDHLIFTGATYTKFGIVIDRNATTADDGLTRILDYKLTNRVSQTVTVERSIDAGITWRPLVDGQDQSMVVPGQTLVVADYEVPDGVTPKYRAFSEIFEQDVFIPSGYSAEVNGSAPLVLDSWWLKDPTDSALNMKVFRIDEELLLTSPADVAEFAPLGRKYKMVLTGDIRGDEQPVNIICMSKAEYDALTALRETQRTLLLQSPQGEQWYIQFIDWQVTRSGIGTTWWKIGAQAVEVDPPNLVVPSDVL